MRFNKKYCSISEKELDENKDKLILSDDAFAIGEVLDELVNQLKRVK